jgi:hypothetical protein
MAQIISWITERNRVSSANVISFATQIAMEKEMEFHRYATRSVCLTLLAAIFPFILPAQAAPPASQTSSTDALMTQLLALRNSFVNQVKAEGFKPSLPPPQIVIDNPPSYGRYEDDSNTLHTSAWQTLPPDQEARFVRLSEMMQGRQTPEELFEEGVHRWVFVHELGHWWQACQHKITDDHYAVEYGANRIAAAFWRLKDPDYMKRRTEHFRAITALLPNPVPEGQSKEKFFNANYGKLAGTPVYTWYQSSMVVDVSAENPAPSFRQTLQ